MKAAKIGSIELRNRDGNAFAQFNTFDLAVRACMKTGIRYADMFECVKLPYNGKVWEPVCTYEVADA